MEAIFTDIGIPIIKSWYNSIFIVGIPTLVRQHLYIEMTSCSNIDPRLLLHRDVSHHSPEPDGLIPTVASNGEMVQDNTEQ